MNDSSGNIGGWHAGVGTMSGSVASEDLSTEVTLELSSANEEEPGMGGLEGGTLLAESAANAKSLR